MAGDIFGQRRMLRRFVTVAAVFGFGMAMFALVQDLSGSDRIYWLVKPVGISAAIYGPYANHNHYAGLMEMLVPLAVAAAVLERGGKRALLVFAAVIMAASIVFSGSRGGILALVVATAFACLAIYAVKRSRRSLLPVLIVAALAAAFTFFTASDQVIRHMTETQDLYRMHIYRDCLRMWWDRPVLGFGWGTFSTVYPQYQSFYSNLRVNHAHNDYLELLVETGVLGTTLMIWFLVAMFRRAWNKIKDRDDYEGRVLTLATLSGVVALLVHSLLDFNLHIPANAALFFALCSAAATPFKQRVTSMPRDAWEDRGPTGIHFGA
jgi:O-antigen ligase